MAGAARMPNSKALSGPVDFGRGVIASISGK